MGDNTNELKKDCYYYYEDIDMGAYVPNCKLAKQYGECPCANCEEYISVHKADEIIKSAQNFAHKISPEKVYVVTAGSYSEYHIEQIFTDRNQAQLYANLDMDREVEEYPVDAVVLDDSHALRVNVVYDFAENKINYITQIDDEWDEYDPHVSNDQYTTFMFCTTVNGKLLREIAENGAKSKMLLKIAQDKFYAEANRLGTTRHELIQEKRKMKEEWDRKFGRYSTYTTTLSTGNPFESIVTKEVSDKLDEMYANGEQLPDVWTLAKMIRESQKKHNGDDK